MAGTPQGGVIGPPLANLYMNRMLKGWEQTRRGERFQARIVAYADDFAILSRGRANEAPGWARGTPTRPGLTLNEAKTSVRKRPAGAVRLFGLHIRPALRQAYGAGVHRLHGKKCATGGIGN